MEENPTTSMQTSFKTILRELLLSAIPIFLTLLAIYGVGFFERICLARYSLEALQGSMQALYVFQLFQGPLINFVTMVQTFLGKHFGAKEFHEVGPSIWQMFWIAMLSMLLIIPLSWIASSIFFKGIEGEASARAYFNMLVGSVFLFPIGIAISSFFLLTSKITSERFNLGPQRNHLFFQF